VLSKIVNMFRHPKSPRPAPHRLDVLIRQFDFILDTLENNKFDIVYMENLKNELTSSEKVYFLQQIDRIESAKGIVLWMRDNASKNTTFWERLLRW
jgi:hypothetical protein